MIEQLRGLVDDAVEKCESILDSAISEINTVADEVQEEAKSEIQSTIDQIWASIDELKEKANEANVDIDDCLVDIEDELSALSNKFIDEMVQCVTDAIAKVIGDARDTLDKIKSSIEEIEDVGEEIMNCESDWMSILRLPLLALQIGEELVTLPQEILSDFRGAVDVIKELTPNLRSMAMDKTTECAGEAEAILLKISMCVAEKMGN